VAILSYEVYTADDFPMLVNQSSRAALREVLPEQIDYHRWRGAAAHSTSPPRWMRLGQHNSHRRSAK
jgi:hypothetical protein